jgi:bacterioferritin-associated ferredoxin
MYVCVCNAVTERQIHKAVNEGAKTVKHLKETLGVGRDCARCVGCAKACIKEAQEENHHGVPRALIQLSPAMLMTN